MVQKECEICGEQFETNYTQQKYCIECGKNPDKTRKEYKQALFRVRINSGIDDIPQERFCKFCNKPFLTATNRVFCGDLCSESHRTHNAKCRVCGSLLIKHGIETGKGVCSNKCADRLVIIKEEERIQKAKDNGDYIPCLWCKKEFVSKNYANKFCCNDCRLNYNADEKLKQASKNNVIHDSHAIETRECVICGKNFNCEHCVKQKYCSKECRVKGTKILQAKKKAKEYAAKIKQKPEHEHLCTGCKTSQTLCERFTSNFVNNPEGCKVKLLGDKQIVIECPRYIGIRISQVK